MKAPRLIELAILFLAAASLVSCSQTNVSRSATSSPIVAVLEAAKKTDVDKFKDAYSKRIREENGQKDWADNLKQAQTTMKEKFGDYHLSDFRFSFEGDDRKGTLAVFFKEKKQFGLAVVKEGDVWKLDER